MLAALSMYKSTASTLMYEGAASTLSHPTLKKKLGGALERGKGIPQERETDRRREV